MAANSDVGVTEAKGLTGKAVVNGNSAVKSGGSSAAGTIVIIDPPTSSLASTKATSASAIQKLKEEEKKIQMVIMEINLQIAVFRDLLIHVGTPKDSAELREKIRRVRRQCVEGCKSTNTQLLPQIKSALSEGTILDNHQLICLYMLSQLLERELDKCLRLVAAIPMDMSGFYETKPTPHGIGSVLSQIVLCKSMKPDFNAEEKVSIEKDTREIREIIAEMAECLPKEDPDKARNGLTNSDAAKRNWLFKRRPRGSGRGHRRGCRLNNMPASFCGCLCSSNTPTTQF